MDIIKAKEIFRIKDKITKDELKERYRSLAKEYHPDLNNSDSTKGKMQEINNAYEKLMKNFFNVLDPWKDYNDWWFKQFGEVMLFGSPRPEKKEKTIENK